MIDFSNARDRSKTVYEVVKDLTPADLRAATNEMVDTMLDIIKDCDDDAVTFQPLDPDANDTYAASDAEVDIAWTLGQPNAHLYNRVA